MVMEIVGVWLGNNFIYITYVSTNIYICKLSFYITTASVHMASIIIQYVNFNNLRLEL